MKLASYIFTAFIFLSSPLLSSNSTISCPSSVMHIESFETSDQQTTVLLNNGTLWKYQDADLFQNKYGWQIGDRVHIVYVNFEGYYLENVSYQGSVPVKLINSSFDDIKTVRISNIIKNNEKSTNTIELDDRTTWFIGSWSSSWMTDWRIGDRMLVTPQKFLFGNADHLLINLESGDKSQLPVCVRAQLMYSPQFERIEDKNKRQAREWKVSVSNTWKQNDLFMVELNNKTIWQCNTVLKNTWQINDEVTFSLDNEAIKLKNLANKEEVKVTLINQSSNGLQTYYLRKNKQNGNKLILNDESIWFMGNCRGTFNRWKRGDRILVASKGYLGSDTATHVLINIDTLSGKFKTPSVEEVTLVH